MRWELRQALLEALAFVFPASCVGCGAEGGELCDACRGRLRIEPLVRVVPGVGEVRSSLSYDDIARDVILAFKESGRTGLAGALAPALRAAIASFGGDPPGRPTTVVPVPSRRAAMRRRGFEPVRTVLARAGVRAVPVLTTTGPRAAQKRLDRSARAENQSGSMAALRPLGEARILLVDDVLTTGATLAEAARAARDAGGEVVGAVVIAATPRRYGSLTT